VVKKFIQFIFFSSSIVLTTISIDQRDIHITLDLLGQEILHPEYAASALQLCNSLNAQAVPILTTLWSWKLLLLAQKAPVQQELQAWDIYIYNNLFVLFIPHVYKQKLGALNCQDLGFNIKNWKAVTDLTGFYGSSFLATCKDLLQCAFNNDILFRNGLLPYYSALCVKVLKDLLITKEQNNFQWNIILNGHGGRSYINVPIICGLYPFYFKQLLQLFNDHIKTRILLYTTCSGGSTFFLNDLYSRDEKPTLYNFTIICACLTDAPAFTIILPEFGAFFKHIHTADITPKKLPEIMKAITYCVPIGEIEISTKTKTTTKYFLNNMPHIRWANKPYFELASINGKVEPLSCLLKQKGHTAHKNPQELVINSRGLIIDKSYIPYTLVLSQADKHIIASTLINQNCYIAHCKIEGVSSESALLGLCKRSLIGRARSQLFLFDSISYNTKQNKTQLENVILFLYSSTPDTYRYQKINTLFYTKDNQGYTVTLKKGKSNIKKLDPKLTKKYLLLFNQEKTKISKGQNSIQPTKTLKRDYTKKL
jgi:hypothetical protein